MSNASKNSKKSKQKKMLHELIHTRTQEWAKDNMANRPSVARSVNAYPTSHRARNANSSLDGPVEDGGPQFRSHIKKHSAVIS